MEAIDKELSLLKTRSGAKVAEQSALSDHINDLDILSKAFLSGGSFIRIQNNLEEFTEKGWKPEHLLNSGKNFESICLCDVMDGGDIIHEITTDYIVINKGNDRYHYFEKEPWLNAATKAKVMKS